MSELYCATAADLFLILRARENGFMALIKLFIHPYLHSLHLVYWSIDQV